MFGALLLSTTSGCRNRNLFSDLITRNAGYVTAEGLPLLLMSTVALDDFGQRIKTGSVCAPVSDVALETVNPHPDSRGRGIVPPDPYQVGLTDYPLLRQAATPDVLAYGRLNMHSFPEEGMGLYVGLSGHCWSHEHDDPAMMTDIPNELLTRLIKDNDPDANFVTKASRDVMDRMAGRYAAQIISAGPDPFLVLMQSERRLHLNFVESHGCFYLVWSDFRLVIDTNDADRNRPYVWSLTTFDHHDTLLMGFSIRMLRNRWVRWLTPKQVPKHVDDVDIMRVPKALAALQQWLVRRTA